ncbi:MAG: hypothetical protein ABS46_06840 [Cytophagaceae bacterium SCN 52-12]|nr:MAG: hypothetical protein ABS46_06840 [Cytophagaceae bacterium SCN 52-12]
MNQSKDNLNEEWRKVFDKASETPPPDIWEGIERRLDERNRVPLAMPWWKKTQAWVAAASVLLALGAGAVLFMMNKGGDAGPEFREQVIASEHIETEAGAQDAPEGPAVAAREPGTPEKVQGERAPAVSRSEKQDKIRKGYPEQDAVLLAKSEPQAVKRDLHAEKPAESSPAVRGEAEESLLALDFIAPPEPREIDTYWQTRYVFFNPYAGKLVEEQPAKPEPGPLWAGLSLMPGGFNPNMQFSHESVYQMNNVVSTGYTAPGNQFSNIVGLNSNRATTDNRDQPKISFQGAAQVGFKLSKRWSIESGVAFLQGNSTSRSPGFFMDRTTHESADLLSNAMASGNANYSDATVHRLQLNSSDAGSSAVYIPMDKNMRNSYSYLQVPAYAGYTFRPEKQLSYTLLGGGITNFFLKNNLETASGYTLETTRENNVYNELNFSAAAGMRLNYRLSGAWNTSLTANYQYSLMNSFKSNRFLTSRPQVYGVSWGVRYTFQK